MLCDFKIERGCQIREACAPGYLKDRPLAKILLS